MGASRTTAIFRAFLALVAFAIRASSASTANAEPTVEFKQACVRAYEQHQVLRKQGDLIGAHRELLACVHDDCPSFVRTDCNAWLPEMERILPSAIIKITLDSHDAMDAHVWIDEVEEPRALSGNAIELNPGQHVLRASVPSEPPQERRIVVREGEKLRLIAFTFFSPPLLSPPSVPELQSTPRNIPRPTSTPWWLWATGGATAVGFAAFSAFAMAGHSEYDRLHQTCRPACTGEDLSALRRDYAVADVGLGLAIFSASTLVVLYLRQPSRRLSTISLPLAPAPHTAWSATLSF